MSGRVRALTLGAGLRGNGLGFCSVIPAGGGLLLPIVEIGRPLGGFGGGGCVRLGL